jgi:hypothetical protein
MRQAWMILVLALGLLTGGCAEMALVGAGAAGGYIYTKGQQPGKSEKADGSATSDKKAPSAPAQPTKPSD